MESTLAILAADLAESPPITPADPANRLRAYRDAHSDCDGSAVALLDRRGRVTASPYVYRTPDGYVTTDLAVPSSDIELQEWMTGPRQAGTAVWTAPYLDAGGGDIWMVTPAMPVRDASNIIAIVTTDLPVDPPA